MRELEFETKTEIIQNLTKERGTAISRAEAAETEVQRLGQALSDKTSEFLRLKSDLAPVVAALKACDFYLPYAGQPSRSMVKQAIALLEKLGVKEEKLHTINNGMVLCPNCHRVEVENEIPISI
jgi:hypothetical protein